MTTLSIPPSLVGDTTNINSISFNEHDTIGFLSEGWEDEEDIIQSIPNVWKNGISETPINYTTKTSDINEAALFLIMHLGSVMVYSKIARDQVFYTVIITVELSRLLWVLCYCILVCKGWPFSMFLQWCWL